MIGAMWLLVACGTPEPAFHGTVLLPPTPAPDFELVDQDGDPWSLATLRGEPVLLFFGFTSCGHTCPMVMRTLQGVNDGARIVFVTVDPATDTPERLGTWLSAFGTDLVGLTGDPDVLAQVRAAYGAWAEQAEPEVAHSAVVYGIDRAGRLRVVLDPEAEPTALTADIHALTEL